MTEERTALLIAEYANGLRKELGLLGASEVNDLVSEVVAMLRDASAGDSGIAAVEIERLGPPAELARTVLEQHGFDSRPGLQAASWWRLGIAAPLDIAVGLAAPLAAAALVLRVVAPYATDAETGVTSYPAIVAWVLLSCVIIATGLRLAWGYWRPWRVGGTEATAGMALAGIAVVTLGGARTVVPTADLAKAGLARPHRSRPGSALTILLACFLLGWSFMALGSPPVGASAGVRAFAGDPAVQEQDARAVIERLYADARDTASGAVTSPSDYMDAALLDTHLDADLARRAETGKFTGEIVAAHSPRAGTWIVEVAEGGAGGARRVSLTLNLRVDWTSEGDTVHTWMVSGYEPSGTR